MHEAEIFKAETETSTNDSRYSRVHFRTVARPDQLGFVRFRNFDVVVHGRVTNEQAQQTIASNLQR